MFGAASIGRIYRIALPSTGIEWFIGEYSPHYAQVVGVCFVSAQDRRVGKEFSMYTCQRVPDEDVPDEIWAELAKWKLTDGA